jgi:hypothetical protein
LHVNEHDPLAHTVMLFARPGQALPHRPQWLVSVIVLRHVPPQQLCPAAQVRPHMPQWLVSVCVLRHIPPQQVWPAPHAIPHAPQWLLSVCVLRQTLLHCASDPQPPVGHGGAPATPHAVHAPLEQN